MSAPEYRRLLERLRELATQAEGALRTIPVGRLAEDLPEGLSIDEQVRRTMPGSDRLAGQPRIEVRPIRLRGRTHPPTGSVQIRAIEVELRVVRALPLDAIKDDDKRYDEHGLAAEDGELLAQVLEWPQNLELTAALEPTGCIALVHASSDGAVRSGPKGAGASQLIETTHRFTGRVKVALVATPAPASTLAPTINVDGGGDPIVGATLVGTPGVWSDALAFTYQWLRDDVAIVGATSLRYTTVAADDGASITLRETAYGAGGSTSADSGAIVVGAAAVPPLPEGFPFAPADAPRHLWIAGYGYTLEGGEIGTWGAVVSDGSQLKPSAVGAREPIARAVAIAASANLNGHPSVGFDLAASANGRMLDAPGQANVDFLTAPSAGATLFLAWFKTGATAQILFDSIQATTANRGLLFFVDTPANARIIFRVGNGVASVVNVTTAIGTVPDGAHYAVIRLLTGGSPEYQIRVDGVELASGAFLAAPSSGIALNPVRLGNRAGVADLNLNPLTGEFGAWGAFDRRVDDVELAALEGWLARYKP